MNIFVLSWNVMICARWYMDKHVHKIIIEIAQLLSATVRLLHPERNVELDKHNVYKVSHEHHPITKWLQQCKPNWDWTVEMATALHNEWLRRYNHPATRVHKAYETVLYLSQNPPTAWKQERTPFTPCVGGKENIIEGDVEESYKQYYMSPGKQRIASWKNVEMPEWYKPDPEHYQKAYEEQKAAREQKRLEKKAGKEVKTEKKKGGRKRKSEEGVEITTHKKKARVGA